MFLLPRSHYTVKVTKEKGRGVFAARDIEPGTVIGDYIGVFVPTDSNDENKKGLYDMRGGLTYDLVANPKKEGIQWINHSCVNNCDAYPYRGHILYFALRKIFKGEELSATYGLGEANEKNIVCAKHACHCESKFCTGTMHESEDTFNVYNNGWEKLVRRNFGRWYRKSPGKFGEKVVPLERYPEKVPQEKEPLYIFNIFGAENKPAARFADTSLPSIAELRERIRATGRRISFPRLHLTVAGIKNNTLIAERR
jgi:hypothetical protein